MRPRMICFPAVALLLLSCICLARAQSAAPGPADIAPFLGSWKGQYEECRSRAACQGRGVDMTVTAERISFTLGPGEGGFSRHSKGSSGPKSKSYPVRFENVRGVTTMSFSTGSGLVMSFTLVGDRLEGQGTSGRFSESFTLKKARR